MDISSSQSAIVGGEESEFAEYPATGALIRGWSYRCTATLIAPDVVLTAGHCLDDHGYGDFGFTLDGNLGDGKGEIVPALIAHRHPGYSRDNPAEVGHANDLGIVILARPIQGVPVEQLNRASTIVEVEVGSELALCGYGVDLWTARQSGGIKRDAMVTVDDATDWELRISSASPQPCKGDSGGPLFAAAGEGNRLLTAIVSRGAGESYKCDAGAIVTRVEPYTDWIEEMSQVREVGCQVAVPGRGWGRARGLSFPIVLGLLAGGLAARRRGRRPRVPSPRQTRPRLD